MNPPRKFLGGRRKNKNAHDIVWQKSRNRSCALPIDIEDDIPAFSEYGLNGLGRRSVKVPEHFGPFKKVATGSQVLELFS